jgi:hypothetical protein
LFGSLETSDKEAETEAQEHGCQDGTQNGSLDDVELIFDQEHDEKDDLDNRTKT